MDDSTLPAFPISEACHQRLEFAVGFGFAVGPKLPGNGKFFSTCSIACGELGKTGNGLFRHHYAFLPAGDLFL